MKKHGIMYDEKDILQKTAVNVACTSIAVNKLTATSWQKHRQDLIMVGLLACYEVKAELENSNTPIYITAQRKDGETYIRPCPAIYKGIEKALKSYIRSNVLPPRVDNPLMVYDTHAKQEGYAVAVAQLLIETSELTDKDKQTAIELLDGVKALRHVAPSIRLRLREVLRQRIQEYQDLSTYRDLVDDLTIDFHELEQIGLTIIYT